MTEKHAKIIIGQTVLACGLFVPGELLREQLIAILDDDVIWHAIETQQSIIATQNTDIAREGIQQLAADIFPEDR